MRQHGRPIGLLDLPPEILFDILAWSFSHQLPLVNKHIFYTLRHASPFVRAHYILRRHHESHTQTSAQSVLHAALSYPMCTVPVIPTLERIFPPLTALSSADRQRVHISPGRWLFRNLPSYTKPKRRKHGPLTSSSTISTTTFGSENQTQSPRSDPLTFLQHLGSRYTLAFSERESAFALAMCVRSGSAQHPLLRFLLQAGADPGAMSCLALQVAATLGDIDTMKILIEPSSVEIEGKEDMARKVKGGKRRRVEDRVHPTSKVLCAAVRGKHTDLAHWLIHEKGVVPDMATMHIIQDM